MTNTELRDMKSGDYARVVMIPDGATLMSPRGHTDLKIGDIIKAASMLHGGLLGTNPKHGLSISFSYDGGWACAPGICLERVYPLTEAELESVKPGEQFQFIELPLLGSGRLPRNPDTGEFTGTYIGQVITAKLNQFENNSLCYSNHIGYGGRPSLRYEIPDYEGRARSGYILPEAVCRVTTQSTPNAAKPCSCDMIALMRYGCRCGGV